MAVEIKKGDALGVLNLTPIIDVVFLLLIFFLVTTQFEKLENQLPLNVPAASEAMPLIAEPSEVYVNIDVQGRYYVDDRQVSLDELRGILRRAAASNPVNQSVIIRADGRTPFQAPIEVINVCNEVGIYDYSAVTSGEGS
jgi:biopolymer transport protein ExbD